MLIAFWTFNNIIVHRLLTIYCGVLSDSYRHQITNKFEKLLDYKDKENTLMIIAPIFLILHIYIRPTRLLKDRIPNTEFDADEKLYPRSIGLDWDDSGKIEEAIATDEDDEDEKKDPWKKNRQLKREKQYQKQVVKARTGLAKAKTCQ